MSIRRNVGASPILPCKSNLAPYTLLGFHIIISLYNSFSLYLQAEGEPTKMDNIEPEQLEEYEESEGEVVLRSERESFLSEWMNKGIEHEPLSLSYIL